MAECRDRTGGGLNTPTATRLNPAPFYEAQRYASYAPSPAVVLLISLSLASCASTAADAGQARTTCDVHRVAMLRDTVPIYYGLVSVTDARYWEEAKWAFPHANFQCFGGCTSAPDSPTRREVLYCPECRKAEAAYLSAHPHRAATAPSVANAQAPARRVRATALAADEIVAGNETGTGK